jgi:hypothetical protein
VAAPVVGAIDQHPAHTKQPKLSLLFARTKRLAKMRDRDPSKIGKAKQCLVRRFAHLSDSLQASREQHVLYTRWESNFTGWCLIRKLWRWLKLAHFFTLQPANPAGFSGMKT